MLILSMLVALGAAVAVNQSEPVEPVVFSNVNIHDQFWSPRIENLASTTLIACIDQCEYKTKRIQNFKRAAGLEEGGFEGYFYDDSDVYKMIEGIAYSLYSYPNPELEARTDNIISYIAAAQDKDGYLNTYFMLKRPDDKWTDMDKHEMYCAGHMIEAAIAYYHATGKDLLLQTAIKEADYFCEIFGEGKKFWVPGHEEIELALVKLYHETGNARYLELSDWLLQQRGYRKGTWGSEYSDYYQDDVPVQYREEIGGHAVRAMYLFSGMADVDAAMGQSKYMAALERLWNDVVYRKMYITGGIGSSTDNEGFTVPYDLPNAKAYCETCASVGMVFWNQRMNLLKGETKYADIMERSMYNGALAGISLKGDLFFYVNPLESDGSRHRHPWFGTACCPSNLSRFLPSIGGYIYATSKDELRINAFIDNDASMKVGNTDVKVVMKTNYPWDGKVSISLQPSKASNFDLKIRIPGWCDDYTIDTKCSFSKTSVQGGYLVLNRKWKKNDSVTIDFAMPVKVVEADPRVSADAGRRAIMRGPLVYCLEEVDNGTEDWTIGRETTYSTKFNPELLNGVMTITATNPDGRQLTFVPYYAWENRQSGKMQVWVKYDEKGALTRLPRKADADIEAAIADYLKEASDTDLAINTLMVLQHGNVIGEAYVNGWTDIDCHHMWSASKTFTSMAVGYAVQEGLLSLDEKMTDIFPEEAAKVLDTLKDESWKKNMLASTVRDYLTMSCGHTYDASITLCREYAEKAGKDVDDPIILVKVADYIPEGEDIIAAFFAQPFEKEPGTQWCYDSWGTLMLSAAVQKRSGKKMVDYLDERLFQPLDMAKPYWSEIGGYNCGGWGLYLIPEEMAKFGQTMLDKGKFKGRQVLPADYLAEAATPVFNWNKNFESETFEGKTKKRGYSYQMWENSDAFYAAGMLGQKIFVLPEYDAVITATADIWNDDEKQTRLIWKHIVPALKK